MLLSVGHYIRKPNFVCDQRPPLLSEVCSDMKIRVCGKNERRRLSVGQIIIQKKYICFYLE